MRWNEGLYSHYSIQADENVELALEMDGNIIDYNNRFFENVDGRIWTDMDGSGHILWCMGKEITVFASVPAEKRPSGGFSVSVFAGDWSYTAEIDAETADCIYGGWRIPIFLITPPLNRRKEVIIIKLQEESE